MKLQLSQKKAKYIEQQLISIKLQFKLLLILV